MSTEGSLRAALGAPEWVARAACRGMDPRLFDVEEDTAAEAIEDARVTCDTCPVQAECLAWAMEQEKGKRVRDRACVIGGLTPTERAKADREGAPLDVDECRLWPVSVTVTRYGRCRACGRGMRKTKTFTEPATRSEREETLERQQAKADRWRPKFIHVKCKRAHEGNPS